MNDYRRGGFSPNPEGPPPPPHGPPPPPPSTPPSNWITVFVTDSGKILSESDGLLRVALTWHWNGRATSPNAESVKHTQALVDEIARLTLQLVEIRGVVEPFVEVPTLSELPRSVETMGRILRSLREQLTEQQRVARTH